MDAVEEPLSWLETSKIVIPGGEENIRALARCEFLEVTRGIIPRFLQRADGFPLNSA